VVVVGTGGEGGNIVSSFAKGLTIQDWFFVATTAFALIKWLIERVKLPQPWQGYLDKLTPAAVLDLINQAELYVTWTDVQRHTWVVQQVQALAEKELGLTVPTHIANMLVDFVYGKFKAHSVSSVPSVPSLKTETGG
jgi:hypothetical protein